MKMNKSPSITRLSITASLKIQAKAIKKSISKLVQFVFWIILVYTPVGESGRKRDVDPPPTVIVVHAPVHESVRRGDKKRRGRRKSLGATKPCKCPSVTRR